MFGRGKVVRCSSSIPASNPSFGGSGGNRKAVTSSCLQGLSLDHMMGVVTISLQVCVVAVPRRVS